MLSTVFQDLTFAFRQFRRSAGFTATVVFTLALGIGATTAIFSLINGVLLRPLQFPQADRLVEISTLEFPPGLLPTNPAAADYVGSSYPDSSTGSAKAIRLRRSLRMTLFFDYSAGWTAKMPE